MACDVMKRCTKFERNRAIRGGVIASSIFCIMMLNMECCAVTFDNLSVPEVAFFMLIRYVTL